MSLVDCCSEVEKTERGLSIWVSMVAFKSTKRFSGLFLQNGCMYAF